MSEASEDTQSACASPTGCLRPGECAHGCSWAVDELTRLGQEMEAPGRIAALEEENRVLRKTVGDLHDGINQIFREALKERNANRALARELASSRAQAWREAADEIDTDDPCGCGGCDSCVLKQAAAELRRKAEKMGGKT